jgi:hypothetical protein
MAKSLKQYSPALQILILLAFFISFGMLAGMLSYFLPPALSGYRLESLEKADLSDPRVVLVWRIIAFISPVFLYLLPALLFARLVSPRALEWLQLNKPVQLRTMLFVLVIMVLGRPMTGILYDWTAAWDLAQSSHREAESKKAIVDAMHNMPNVAYLLRDLLLFELVAAVARICFFYGVFQQVLIRVMPKAPWVAIAITSVIYGASFFQWQNFASLILIGFQIGAIFYLTRNLWLSVVAEFILSSIQWFKFYSHQHGWTNEDPQHPSPTAWYYAVLSLAITVGLLWYFRKRIPRPAIVIDYQAVITSIGNTGRKEI